MLCDLGHLIDFFLNFHCYELVLAINDDVRAPLTFHFRFSSTIEIVLLSSYKTTDLVLKLHLESHIHNVFKDYFGFFVFVFWWWLE